MNAKHDISTTDSSAKYLKTALAYSDVEDILESNLLKEIGLSEQAIGSSDDLLWLLISIFAESSDGLSIIDKKGNFIAINQASCDLCGMTKKEFLGRNVEYFIKKGIWDRSVALEVLKTKQPANRMVYVKSTRKYILNTGTPLFDKNGDVLLVLENERDISQLVDLKRKLEKTLLIKQKYKDQLAELRLKEFDKYEVVANSPAMHQVLTVALRLAQMDVMNVIIQGESGTGKGILAEFIHKSGKRKKNPFIQINCAAVPENLLEAELFGYEQGAFTGASPKGKAGLFEIAHKGTLFLDEIGEMPLTLQAKLLKYMDDRKIWHLGGLEPIKVDCVVLGASNKDLEELVKNGSFRKDLFYRLNTACIKIPPLRKRREDIVPLAYSFLKEANSKYNVDKRFNSGVMQKLLEYQFPGNVRELKNIIQNSVIMSDSDTIINLPLMKNNVIAMESIFINDNRSYGRSLSDQIFALEKTLLKSARKKCRTTREMAAYLGTSQTSLLRKLKKHGIGSMSRR